MSEADARLLVLGYKVYVSAPRLNLYVYASIEAEDGVHKKLDLDTRYRTITLYADDNIFLHLPIPYALLYAAHDRLKELEETKAAWKGCFVL